MKFFRVLALLVVAPLVVAQNYQGKTVAIPYQVAPTYGNGLNYKDYGTSFSSFHNIFQNCGYAKISSATGNTVACFGEAEAAVSGANVWGGNHVGIATASGANAIADEIDSGAIVSGGLSYGVVVVSTGYYPSQSALQIQANRWAAPFSDGIFFNTSSTGQAVSSSGNLIYSSNATLATYAIKLPGIYSQEMYLPSLQVGATPTNKLISTSVTGNGVTAVYTITSSTNFPWIGSTMTGSGFGNAGFNAACTVTASTATTASCLNATNASSTNGAITVSNPTITVTGGSLSSGTCTLTHANTAATGYPQTGNKIIVDGVVSSGNSSGQNLTGYNGNFTVVTSSATQITYACPLAAGNYVSGGTIDDYPISAVVAQLKVSAASAPGNTVTLAPISAGQGATDASILFTGLGTGKFELGATTTYADASGNLFTAGPITSSLATGTAPFTVASTTVVSNLNSSLLGGKTFADPGPIGSGTPSSGAFTTLTSSSGVPLTSLATQATNTVVANVTSGTAVPTASAVGSCSTAASALKWTTNTGFGCNTAIDAATLGTATFASPGAIGGSTPAAGTFTTLSSTTTPTVNSHSLTVTLFRWGVPVFLASSGSFANNGALTLTTAVTNLTTICSTTVGCYMYFPVNAIAAGVAAGVYYATCTSTTACTIYNNKLTTGVPVHIVSPTAFAVTGPGAFTQTTGAQLAMITLSIPGNSIGANGSLTVTAHDARISNANSVSNQVTYGGTAFGIDSPASVQWYGFKHSLYAMGATNAQAGIASTAASDDANINAAPTYMAIDSTSAQNLVLNLNLTAAATDWIAILGGAVTADYEP